MFETTQTKIVAVNEATALLPKIRIAYNELKALQALLARYKAGTDASFVASVNAIYPAADRAELAAVIAHTNALVTELETNHKAAIGI